MSYANGDVFEGEWAFDAKHGPGTFTYTSRGRRWEAGSIAVSAGLSCGSQAAAVWHAHAAFL